MKKLLDMATEIVQAQASLGHMSTEEIERSFVRIFSTLRNLQQAEERGICVGCCAGEAIKSVGAGWAGKEPGESIQDDKVVCLECGAEMRQLTIKHLRTHNLTPGEYKQKWGFAMKQPLSARSLTRARSEAARERGLPPGLVKILEERKQKKI